MAFDATKLAKIGGADKQLWHYYSADAIATIMGANYFNSVYTNFKQWDLILTVGLTGGAATVDILNVTSATGAATVVVSATEGITAT